MVVEPIDLNTFKSNFSLDSTFESLKDELGFDDDFVDSISSAYAEGDSLVRDGLFDPAFEVDNPALGVRGNAFTGDVRSGRPLDVSGGSLTLSTESTAEKLVVAPYHELSVRKSSEGTLTVFDETTGKALQLEPGNTLRVTGEGQAELVSGKGKSLRLESGEALTVKRDNQTLKLEESTFRNTLSLSDAPQVINVTGSDNSAVTLYTGANESVRFSPGDSGTIQSVAEDQVRITNKSTGESLTVGSLETMKAQGDAEVLIGKPPLFQVEDGDKVTFSRVDSGIQLRNKSVSETVTFGGTDQSRTGQDRALQVMSDPNSEQIRVFDTLLDHSGLTVDVSEDEATGSPFGSVDQIIEPFDEREIDELLGNEEASTEEGQSAFFAERQVAETFEELPDLISEDEGEGFSQADAGWSHFPIAKKDTSILRESDEDATFTILEKDHGDRFEASA